MNSKIAMTNVSGYPGTDQGEKGSALIIALFVLALVGAFTALAITRTATEATAVGNESSEGRTFYAAQGSLEMMTRNFNKVFETKLNPTTADINKVRDAPVPDLSDTLGGNFNFVQEPPTQTSPSRPVVLTDKAYSGLYAVRDTWRLRTTATEVNTGTQVQLSRNILNNRIPIFQFGVFYDDDLELYRPPLFSFGGRVHTNKNFFISPGSAGVYFDSRVTAVGHIVTQSWKNGYTGDSGNNQTFIKNASGVNKQLLPTEGSVLNGTPNVFGTPSTPLYDTELPSSRLNSGWGSASAKFDGNLVSLVPELKLPLKVTNSPDLAEMVRRGKQIPDANGGDLVNNNGTVEAATTPTADGEIMKAERFANKTGIRISLADSKAKLPGCASGTGTSAVTTPCGVRLDGSRAGDGANPMALAIAMAQIPPDPGAAARGYQPKAMKLSSTDATNGYVPTRVNGERLYTAGRQVWIKVETVATRASDGAIVTNDITEDILSLGVTEEAPSGMSISSPGYTGTRASNGTATSPSTNITATSAQTASTYPDSRSIIKIQRFAIPGPAITDNSNVLTSGSSLNYVMRYSNATTAKFSNGCTGATPCTAQDVDPNSSLENYGHLKLAFTDKAVVPFPIEMFDSREGLYYDSDTTQPFTTKYSNTYYAGGAKVSWNGVMSMIDIDVANLRRFLRGDFNGLFPQTGTPFANAAGRGLINTDIPDVNGWVFYVSDRRGDADFDGKYDMEDIYVNDPCNDRTTETGEDLDPPNTYGNGVLNYDFTNEASRYCDTDYTDRAAVNGHKYYRRGVRLINGTTLPGIYDSATPANTKGFTVSSENGVYVLGNYNATGVTSVPATGNTPYNQYLPFDTALHIPASIVADAVTILSNGWQDAQSFTSPYNKDGTDRQATDTTIRFAMIAGDTVTTRDANPDQGGISPRMNGGVHNFKRFLEKWTGDDLSYAGSLINLFNSHNNNGSFKCCERIYDPPRRNWVFDSTFLDPTRLPPGTPFFQYAQTTGFERSNS